MRWVINKKRYAIFDFSVGVLLNILNMMIFSIVLDLFLRVSISRSSDWYLSAVNQMTDSDVFFRDKAELIFYTLGGLILVLGIFCIVVLWTFREQQIGKIESQTGIFRACGYSAGKVKRIVMADGCVDVLVAGGLTLGIFPVVIMRLCRNETLQAIYRITGDQMWIRMTAVVAAEILFLVATMMHAYIWVETRKKETIVCCIKGRI